MKTWFTRCYKGISYHDILGRININSISVGTITRSMNINIREYGSLTLIYAYVSSWTINDVQVTNTKTIA